MGARRSPLTPEQRAQKRLTESQAELLEDAADSVLEATTHLDHTVEELGEIVRNFRDGVQALLILERQWRGPDGPPRAGA
jgi:hypothetical protein